MRQIGPQFDARFPNAMAVSALDAGAVGEECPTAFRVSDDSQQTGRIDDVSQTLRLLIVRKKWLEQIAHGQTFVLAR
mgnify:CR=1 FL=1